MKRIEIEVEDELGEMVEKEITSDKGWRWNAHKHAYDLVASGQARRAVLHQSYKPTITFQVMAVAEIPALIDGFDKGDEPNPIYWEGFEDLPAERYFRRTFRPKTPAEFREDSESTGPTRRCTPATLQQSVQNGSCVVIKMGPGLFIRTYTNHYIIGVQKPGGNVIVVTERQIDRR